MNLIAGKSIMDISLPIKIFDKQSFLEKISNFMKYAPIFLEKAANIGEDQPNYALERFKNVVAYSLIMRHQAV